MQGRIKAAAAEHLDVEPPCLYGGSVNLDNAAALIRKPQIDGLFIGRAAWDVAGYLAILATCAEALMET